MANARKLILLIHGGHSIDTESAKMARRGFAEHGYEMVELSVLDPEAKTTLKTLLRDRGQELFFFYSSNFWAINIHNDGRLLHTLTGIPLVILMHDHPVYFLHQLSPSLDGALIFAPSEDLAEFIAKYYPIAARTVVNTGIFPPDKDECSAPVFEQFLGRENRLLCPMNLSVHGLNIDDIWAGIKALPEPRRARAMRLIDAALTDCLTPLHVVSGNLAAAGDPELEMEDLRWVYNFIKLWRRTWLVTAIVDLPVCISSAYVPAELERRHPNKFTLLSMPETIPLYARYRFIVNSSPMNAIHDRVTEALINNSVCVTDPNATIAQYFRDDRDMVFVEYKQTDLAERLARLIDNPERAFEMTVNCYRIWSQPAFFRGSYRHLLDAVETMWATADPARAVS